ncbi:MAG: DivIVA domain-containing protein [Chloroherpetonaceae bacterium]|nr:DivIVA domain-containing protein [Chloroherpetonaceae bacterium]MDW8437432.1 DivIVA domain-containing protein [Chloroherpetonaceae bacterium]
MRLTPIDIKKHSFNTAFRGFAPEEVEAFLDVVSRQWEEVLDELDRAKRRIAELEGETKKYKEVEAMLHQTLAQAQQSTNAVIENAKREAELIRQEAEIKSQQLIERAKLEVSAMADDVRRLETQKRELTSKLRLMLSSQLELLNAFSDGEESFILQEFANKKALAEQKPREPRSAPDAQPMPESAPTSSVAPSEPPAPEPPKSQTIKIEVPVEPSYPRAQSKKTVNIDDILSGLE